MTGDRITGDTDRRRSAGRRLRMALLPSALALASLAGAAHAADGWVATRTGPLLLPQAAATAQSAGYKLNIHGTPDLAGTLVTPLESSQTVHVAVSLKLRNADQLEAFNRELGQPDSANYHKFLTPAEFKARYAPTDAQVQAVVAHLQSNGFTNIEVADNNQLVTADGNAGNIAAAFHASMKRFTYAGAPRFANDSPAMVPQALGEVVNAVVGLQNVSVKHTLYHLAKPAYLMPNAAATELGTLATQAGHSPTDFAGVYDAGSVPAATNTTVGIITWGSMTQVIKDLGSFTSKAGLSTVSTQTVNVGSGTFWNDADSNVEWCLDSQSIIGTSGGVKKLIFYAAVNGTNDGSLTDAGISAAYNKAASDNLAQVVNISLGEDETAANSSGTQATDDQIFAQAVAQGQTFSVSSGDEGVYESYRGDIVSDSSGQVLSGVNLSNYTVSEPASSPNVIAVGGTTLSTNGSAWAGETVWNEGLAQDQSNPSDDRLWATGGGVSKFENAPSWQSAALGGSTTKRVLPDVAFDAAQATGANIIANGQQYQVGGTSLASPIFVGVWARVQSSNNNALGFPAAKFYAAIPSNPTLVHDVTSGNNGYSGHGYTAATGWDYTTGFGSLDIAKLNSYAQANWGGGGGGSGGTPSANFSYVANGLTVNFTDASTDSGGSLSAHAWTFGDGASSTAANPSHTYAAAGTYSVTETVTDSVSGKTSAKTASVTVTAGSGGGSSQLLGNTGFESGTASPWSISSGALCSNSGCSGETAHAGSWFAWLDGYGQSHTDTVAQTVSIPAGKSSATLQYYLHVDTDETTGSTAYDKLTVQVLSSSGAVLGTVATYSNLNAASGYAVHTANLSQYIGQTVTLKFTGSEDSSLQTSFVLDDVTLTVQ